MIVFLVSLFTPILCQIAGNLSPWKVLEFSSQILYEPCFENIGDDASMNNYNNMSSNDKGVLPLKVGQLGWLLQISPVIYGVSQTDCY